MKQLHERTRPNQAGYRDILPAQVRRIIGKTRLIDVREAHELTGDLGHIAGVENVPLASIEAASSTWSKEEDIVLVCRSGGRSGRAAALLAFHGFTRVMNMVGGMLAWNEAALPIER